MFQGIWTGMICGTLIQTVILAWVTFRTDWTKEVLIFKRFSGRVCPYASTIYFIDSVLFKNNWILLRWFQVEEASKRLDIWSNKKLEVVPE